MKPQVNEKPRLADCVYSRPTAAIRLHPGSDQEGLVPAAATAGSQVHPKVLLHHPIRRLDGDGPRGGCVCAGRRATRAGRMHPARSGKINAEASAAALAAVTVPPAAGWPPRPARPTAGAPASGPSPATVPRHLMRRDHRRAVPAAAGSPGQVSGQLSRGRAPAGPSWFPASSSQSLLGQPGQAVAGHPEAAARKPVLLLAGDVHRMNPSSQQALAFVARRISSDRIVLIPARRP